MQSNSSNTISDLKADFEKIKPTLTNDAQLLFSMMFSLIEILLQKKMKTTSDNSNTPPSQDPFRNKDKKKKNKGGKKLVAKRDMLAARFRYHLILTKLYYTRPMNVVFVRSH